jgi:hypothetical protein
MHELGRKLERSENTASLLSERPMNVLTRRVVEGLGHMDILHDSGNWERLASQRRQTERKRFRTFAQLILPSGHTVAARTYDLGPDGISVVAPVNLTLKSRCEVVFRLPTVSRKAGSTRISARVTHSILSRQQDGFMIGLNFVAVHESDLSAITGYMAVKY